MRVHAGIQCLGGLEQFCVDAVLFGPLGAAFGGRGRAQQTEVTGAHFAFHSRTHHEGTDAHRKFAQADGGIGGGIGDVHRAGDAHTTAYTMAVDASYHEHRNRADGVDHMGEAAEELQSARTILDGHELIEAGAGTEGLVALAPQRDHAHRGVVATGGDGLGHPAQDVAGEAVALGVVEGDRGDALVHRVLHITIAHDGAKIAMRPHISSITAPRRANP